MASNMASHLQKLERVQLSTARIIIDLHNFCPKYIVLYEANLQPLSLRRNACLVKYYNKLSSLGFQNGTSKFLGSWSSNQKLKRGNPLGHVVYGHLVASSIEHITAYLRLLTLLRVLMEFTFMLTSLSKLANKRNCRAT
ncbi:RNase H domain-containing protein [Trichonephila clavipes]|nr:RNase H domain-containing protein [Trichonephila clavipes]